MGPMCARCMAEVPLGPAPCTEDPKLLANTAIGMYHCPDCGSMVLAGVEHPPLCEHCARIVYAQSQNHGSY